MIFELTIKRCRQDDHVCKLIINDVSHIIKTSSLPALSQLLNNFLREFCHQDVDLQLKSGAHYRFHLESSELAQLKFLLEMSWDLKKIHSDEIPTINPADEPKNTSDQGRLLSPNVLSRFQPPTKLWMSSNEHTYYDEHQQLRIWGHTFDSEKVELIDGWTPKSIQAIPTEACIEQEAKYLNTHVSVYHATTRASYGFDLFCRGLKQLAGEDNRVAWICDFHTKPKITDIEVIKKTSQSKFDNGYTMAWHLSSCSPSLWQNADFASEESTVDYFYDNNSVRRLPFEDMMNQLWAKEGSVNCCSLKAFFASILEFCANPVSTFNLCPP